MAGQQDDRTAAEKFQAYNEFARNAVEQLARGDLANANVSAQLAVAFELRGVNATIKFGRRSS